MRGKQTLVELADKQGRSHVWVRRQLDAAKNKKRVLAPQPTVIIADTTVRKDRRYKVISEILLGI